MASDKITRIAIFGSGDGSNAQAIINYFASHADVVISLIVSNRKKAFILERAANENIPALYFPKEKFASDQGVSNGLDEHNIDLIILAGFLLLIPPYLVEKYPNRILNIHPALLPKYGGKGMYGMNVHRAVQAANEPKSGISIHYVNEHYDEGNIIAQIEVALEPGDAAEVIAQKVLALEHAHYPEVIEREIEKLASNI